MSSGITDYGANALGDHVSGVAALPSTLYVALCTVQPDPGTDGTVLATIEPTGSYARQALPRNSTYWGAASQGISATILDITFPTATADWGTITHYALCSALTAGVVYGFGILASTQRVLAGGVLTVPAGAISMAFSGLQNAMVL